MKITNKNKLLNKFKMIKILIKIEKMILLENSKF